MRRTKGICTLEASQLARLPWLVHGFSTRVDASRAEAAAPFNLGFTDADSRPAVAARRRRFAAALGAANWPVAAATQFHSDAIYVFNDAHVPSEPPRADGLIAQASGLLLTVQTADCVPILLVDTRRRAIAAVHAGWRGTLARIVQKTLGQMRMSFGTRPADVIASLGPSIGPCCYEVGPEVAQAFAGLEREHRFAREFQEFAGQLAAIGAPQENGSKADSILFLPAKNRTRSNGST